MFSDSVNLHHSICYMETNHRYHPTANMDPQNSEIVTRNLTPFSIAHEVTSTLCYIVYWFSCMIVLVVLFLVCSVCWNAS
jgi:hypothetical protein